MSRALFRFVAVSLTSVLATCSPPPASFVRAALPSRATTHLRLPSAYSRVAVSSRRLPRPAGPRATASRSQAGRDMHAAVKLEPCEAPEQIRGDVDEDMWRCLVDRQPAELRCGVTLVCGQSFRWRATGDGEWTGVIADQMVSVREDERSVHFTAWRQIAPPEASAVKHEPGADPTEGALAMQRVRPDDSLMAAVTDYFGLATPLAPLYRHWADSDPVWAQLATRFPGLRVLRQDPVECLFCFICSSNNNIARIALMVDRLSQTYGKLLGTHGGYNFYTFPTIESLAAADEDDLRALGTGYRAKFILRSATTVLENGGRAWLQLLRSSPTSHFEARDALITLHGVGLKVADCVCLFALDKTAAIPVDTHVWQITLREMDASLSEAKSLTPTIYDQVGRLWKDRYGEHAGWAHTILFAADLTKFKKLRNEALGEDDSSASASPAKKRKSNQAKVEEGGCTPEIKEEKTPTKATAKKRKSPAKSSADEASKSGGAVANQGEDDEISEPHTKITTPTSKKSKKTADGAAALYEAIYGQEDNGQDVVSPRFKPTPSKNKKTRSKESISKEISGEKSARISSKKSPATEQEREDELSSSTSLQPRQLNLETGATAGNVG